VKEVVQKVLSLQGVQLSLLEVVLPLLHQEVVLTHFQSLALKEEALLEVVDTLVRRAQVVVIVARLMALDLELPRIAFQDHAQHLEDLLHTALVQYEVVALEVADLHQVVVEEAEVVVSKKIALMKVCSSTRQLFNTKKNMLQITHLLTSPFTQLLLSTWQKKG
jgi:hypothetical protein